MKFPFHRDKPPASVPPDLYADWKAVMQEARRRGITLSEYQQGEAAAERARARRERARRGLIG